MSQALKTSKLQEPLPRGADYSALDKKSRNLNEAGSPLRLVYGDIPMLCDGIDVHELAYEAISRHTSVNSRVLDVGAGPGAFSKRLRDNGYTNVEAVEVNTPVFKLPDVKLYACNLDKDWAEEIPGEVDAIVTIEVFEHMENPWHFARQCAAAVRPGGVIVMTTPNIQSSRSRIEFLLKAEHRFFRQKDYKQMGHLSSMTHQQIRWVFVAAGCVLVESGHSNHKGVPRINKIKNAFKAGLYLLTYPLMGGAKHGESVMMVFRKPA